MADPHRPAYLQDEDDPSLKWWPWLQKLQWRGFKAVGVGKFGFIGIKRRPGLPTRIQMPSDFVAELRRLAYKRSRKRCIYCRERVCLHPGDVTPTRRMATLEHKTPLSRGGTWKKSNLGCSCTRCNKLKSDMTDEEFRSIVVQHGFGDHHLRNAAKDSQRQRSRRQQRELNDGMGSRTELSKPRQQSRLQSHA